MAQRQPFATLRGALGLALGAALIAAVVATILFRRGPIRRPGETVRVLAYSAFLNAWGPGPLLAREFKKATGLDVEFRDAGDAGLLPRKLDLFPSDVVVGFDQLSLPAVREHGTWRPLKGVSRFDEPEFLAFDYGPMTFVYRAGGIKPPVAIDDLLDTRFKGSLSLEDPRTSTPGLEFLYWILDVKGVDEGFAFLEKLKISVGTTAASWSAAYGLLTSGRAEFAYSYLTSPLYHKLEEKDDRYRGVIFKEGLPLQIEYVGVPANCEACAAGERFALFLQSREAQQLIMTKNYMLPVVSEVANGTPFAALPEFSEWKWRSLAELQKHRGEFFDRWRRIGL